MDAVGSFEDNLQTGLKDVFSSLQKDALKVLFFISFSFIGFPSSASTYTSALPVERKCTCNGGYNARTEEVTFMLYYVVKCLY